MKGARRSNPDCELCGKMNQWHYSSRRVVECPPSLFTQLTIDDTSRNEVVTWQVERFPSDAPSWQSPAVVGIGLFSDDGFHSRIILSTTFPIVEGLDSSSASAWHTKVDRRLPWDIRFEQQQKTPPLVPRSACELITLRVLVETSINHHSVSSCFMLGRSWRL